MVAGGVASALMLSVMAAPALATHNKTVPADECAPEAAQTPGSNGESTDAVKMGAVDQGPQESLSAMSPRPLLSVQRLSNSSTD